VGRRRANISSAVVWRVLRRMVRTHEGLTVETHSRDRSGRSARAAARTTGRSAARCSSGTTWGLSARGRDEVEQATPSIGEIRAPSPLLGEGRDEAPQVFSEGHLLGASSGYVL
jgi:hypothetical protein